MSERVLALIDGNSFYCSCERVFDGRLAKRPVIVLSNNDGCAIARTAEAKALGIGMGAPYFMIRDLCRREGVAVFSSNYALYGDMSARMNEVYRSFSPDVETYSIDESFLDLTGFTRRDLVAYARDLRETIRKWIGIPTCVGTRPHQDPRQARKPHREEHPGARGVCDLTDPMAYNHWLVRVPADQIWGVGPAPPAALLPMVAKPSPTCATLIPALPASP